MSPAGKYHDISELNEIALSWFRDYREILRIEIGQLREYTAKVEILLSEQSQKFKKDIRKQLTGISEDERADFLDWCADELNQLEHAFPRILRYSVFVSSYSFFEKALLQIVNYCRHTYNLKLSPSDLKGEGVLRAKTYLKKVASVQFPETGSAWRDIDVLRLIRNLIVHHDGEMRKIESTKNERRIKKFIERKKWKDYISLNGLQI